MLVDFSIRLKQDRVFPPLVESVLVGGHKISYSPLRVIHVVQANTQTETRHRHVYHVRLANIRTKITSNLQLPVKTVRLANIKTRLVNLRAKVVLQDNTKIRMDKLGANTVVKVLTKIRTDKLGVKTVVVDNIPTRTLELGANPVVKVIIKTKLGKPDVKHVTMDSILTRIPDLDAKNVELVGMGVMDYIVATNGLHPLILMYLTNILVTNTNHAHGKVTGRKIVGRRAMHRGNQPVGMVIIIENVATTRKIISMSLIGFQLIMQQVVPSVTLHQREGLDSVVFQEKIVVVEELKIVSPRQMVKVINGVFKNNYISLNYGYTSNSL